MSIRKYRKATYQGTVTYANSAALVTALKGDNTFRGAMWNEFEGGSGVIGIPAADQIVFFVQDDTVATTFHRILLEPSFAVA